MTENKREAPAPLFFEDIHYYFRDRPAAIEFFKRHFGAREMAHPGRPVDFIDFLSLRFGEAPVTVSPKGPYEGVNVRSDARWKRQVVEPSEDAAPYYGVYWLGLQTPSLRDALAQLEAGGVKVHKPELRLPGDPAARAAAVWGPDYNLLAIVERPDMRPGYAGYGLDHLQLLVEDADANAKLFQDVYAGELVESRGGTRVLKVADILVVISEPADLGLDPAAVEPRDVDTTFRYGVDHISWLFEDVYAAAAAAKAKGYTFKLEPIRFVVAGEPTLYDFGYLFTPEGLQCELVSEQWRVGPRTVFKPE